MAKSGDNVPYLVGVRFSIATTVSRRWLLIYKFLAKASVYEIPVDRIEPESNIFPARRPRTNWWTNSNRFCMANVKALCRRVLHRLVGSPDLACQGTPELHGIVHGYQVKLEISMLAQTTQNWQYHYTNTTQATNIQVMKKMPQTTRCKGNTSLFRLSRGKRAVILFWNWLLKVLWHLCIYNLGFVFV